MIESLAASDLSAFISLNQDKRRKVNNYQFQQDVLNGQMTYNAASVSVGQWGISMRALNLYVEDYTQ